jgi:hypothetical protein
MRESMRLRLAVFVLACVALQVGTSLALEKAPKWIGAFVVEQRVGLKWAPVEGAAGYAIYRSVTAGSGYELIANVAETQYFDETAEAGETYYYVLAGLDAGEAEGPRSDERSATMPGVKKGAKLIPRWVGSVPSSDGIGLRWTMPAGATAVAFNVYRSVSPGSGYELVGSTQQNNHVDTADMVEGQKYYYVLTSLDKEFNESDRSKELEAVFEAAEVDAAKAGEGYEELPELVEFKLSHLFDVTAAGAKDYLNQPADVYINSQGELFLTDTLNHRILVYDREGKYLRYFGGMGQADEAGNGNEGNFFLPMALTVGPDDKLYVSDSGNYRIQVFDREGKFQKKIVGKAGPDGKPFKPMGLAHAPNGDLYVSDQANHRVQVFDPSGNFKFMFGEKGEEEGNFIFPDELAVDAEGNVWVVDMINNRIEVFESDGTFKFKFGEVGDTAGSFARPKAIFLGPNNLVYVCDAMFNLIQVFDTDGVVKSIIGKFGDEERHFDNPRGIFVTADRLYICDRGHNRLIVYRVEP